MWETCIKPKAEVYEPMTKLVGYKEEEGTQGQKQRIKKEVMILKAMWYYGDWCFTQTIY